MNQLLPYQIEGIEFASKHRNTLIADEMGLGKTIQAIGYINANAGISKVIVICPKSLVINWRHELDRWLTRKEVDIEIISFGVLHKLPSDEIDLIVIDEAHFIKNPKSQRSQEAKRITSKAKHVLLLTGTPIENRPLELWPLLQILDAKTWDPAGYIKKGTKRIKVGPGEGANFFCFAKRYCGAKKVTIYKRGTPKSFWDFTGASNLDELNDWLCKTGMIRRLKKDVLPQLPPKQHQIIVFPSEENEDGIFPELNEDNYDEVIRKLKADKVLFSEWSKKRHEQGLAKVANVSEHLIAALENGVEKIIVFTHHIDVILGLLLELNFHTGCVKITGDMSAEERQDSVDIFKDDPNCKIIIGSIGAMGVGLNLTESSYVVFAEIDPVPGRMNQAIDRAHRIGQEANGVLVQYLVFDKTLDARMCKILVKKQKVIDSVLNEG